MGTEQERLEAAIVEILELVKQHDEELEYDCKQILDRCSWT